MNKMTNCKVCGKEISKGVKCPNCGKDNRNFFMKHKIVSVISIIVAVAVISGGCGSDKEQIKVNDNNGQAVVQNVEQTAKYEIDIESASSDEYGFSYKISGKLTNNYRDVSYIQITIPLYDAEGNKLGTALANCNSLKKGESWKFEAVGLYDGVVSYGEPEVDGF